MKSILKASSLAALVTACVFLTASAHGQPSPTALTYNGRLTDGTNAVNGWYDLNLAVFDSTFGGTALGKGTQTVAHVAVIASSFTVTADFGTNVFNGSARYMELAVRTNGIGSYAVMSPRYSIASVPVAQYALTPAGPAGQQGNPGINGTNGLNGLNGTNGLNGLNGTNGINGAARCARITRRWDYQLQQDWLC